MLYCLVRGTDCFLDLISLKHAVSSTNLVLLKLLHNLNVINLIDFGGSCICCLQYDIENVSLYRYG